MADRPLTGNHRGKTLSNAEFRRLWTDPSKTQRQIAEELGISENAALLRAQARGLGRVGYGRAAEANRSIKTASAEEFLALWNAGVSLDEMAVEFNCAAPTIWRHAKRIGAPPRRRGANHTPALAVKMAASARETAAAMRAADQAMNRGRP